MKSVVFFCFFILFLPSRILLAEINNSNLSQFSIDTHPKNWKNDQILAILKKGKIISIRPMKEHLESCGKKVEFDGEVYLVELDNGHKAVFKTFPPRHMADAYAEVAAYEASRVLGFPHIPPTVMTTLKDQKGSLQLFVETDVDSLVPDLYEAALKNVSADDMANLKLFYFVFGQWDTGPHNTLILKDKTQNYLIAIDNSAICNPQYVRYGELPFVQLYYSDRLQTNDDDKPFPFDQAEIIKKPTTQKIRKIFGHKLPEDFYQQIKFYGPTFRYVIYRNALWKQFHAGDEDFVLSFTDYLPEQTRKSLEGLNLAVLKRIFACAKGEAFLTPGYLQTILDRRDQVLTYFKRKALS
jgi:hypothetical protein